MTDVTILGKLTECGERSLVITETTSGKSHKVYARKSLVDRLRNVGLNNIIKVRGYLSDDDAVIASKAFVIIGEEEE